MLTEVPQKLIEFIKKYNTFFVLGHSEPDGDCLGSQKAMAFVLKEMGKKAILCSAGPFIRNESKELKKLFAKSISESGTSPEGAAVIILDCSTPERIGEVLAEEIKGMPVAIIDHHASGQLFGDVSFVNGKSPAATVMVYQLMKELGIKPDKETAEDLFFGFLTDTGYFRHLNDTQADSLLLMSELPGCGLSLKSLYFRMYGGRSLESRILTGRTLSRAESLCDGRCILIYQTIEEKKQFGAENRDSDTINSQLLSVEGCEAIIFIREETENSCSISLRSRDEIDVGKIAASFGGGGHKNAAGCEWKGTRVEAETALKKAFTEVFASAFTTP